MGFLKSTKGSIISDSFKLESGLPNMNAGMMVDVALYDDHITFTSLNKKTADLAYSKITDVQYTDDIETLSKSKSPIGRAIVGKMLFGNIGAQVGAISGVGTKEKKVHHFNFIISYDEDNFIVFEDTRMYKGSKVYKKLRELCSLVPEEHIEL